jgi:hypothetical protein
MPTKNLPPILEHKHHAAPAVFLALPSGLPQKILRQVLKSLHSYNA